LRLLIATTNPDKLREIRRVLAHTRVDLLSLRDLSPVAEAEETGSTFQENARLKALYYDERAGAPPGTCTVAEDSGLVVDALDGEPGVYSARFVRADASYPERFAEIQRRLAEHPARPRSARFVCAVALVRSGEVLFETVGLVEGQIADSARGSAGFGYDPIFFYPPYGCTLAEVTEEQKLAVAHRGRAFRQLAMWLLEEGLD
jgi:XTP/dITP diphosphohydrolase